MSSNHLAHSANVANKVDLLREHLRNVAERAAKYAAAFNASDEAIISGLLHDSGKYGYLFQKRLEGKECGIDHWSIGAWTALLRYREKGIASALAVQGHHIGLQQASKDSLQLLHPEKLKKQHPLGLRLSEDEVDSLLKNLDNDELHLPSPDSIDRSIYEHSDSSHVACMLDVRMLFSTLVDADFIETEAHFNPNPDGSKRYREPGISLEPEQALESLTGYLEKLAKYSEASKDINSLRADLLNDCLEAASTSTGLFTLTAPTGSGKTLSMLAFALNHAVRNRLRRIIFVIPYLSIIEQTAQEYREIFSGLLGEHEIDRYLLEHHSLAGFHGDREYPMNTDMDMEDEGRRLQQLLSENWDAPIIITTSVQFLESLFSNRPSSCRKLHRLAKSVILFDEVQTLPNKLSVPTLAALSRLTERFGASVVFSTATQPAFTHLNEDVKKFCASGWEAQEIVSRDLRLFERAKRVNIIWPLSPEQKTTWIELASQLSAPKYDQALCVVNMKRHALGLYEELRRRGASGLLHLSTNMCPSHRQGLLREVHRLLGSGLPCRLISTQCVEAGVDMDFPVVFRAWGPLDALAQAAGRCNRNGILEYGEFHPFFPEEEGYPDGAYRQAAGICSMLFQKYGTERMSIDNPQLFEQYFSELYDFANVHKKDLAEAIKRRDFRDSAKNYRVIDQDAINVLVPYNIDYFDELVNEVRETGLAGAWIRKARPHSIGLFRPRDDDPVLPYLEPVPVGRYSNSDEWFIYLKKEHYSKETGLTPPPLTGCLIA